MKTSLKRTSVAAAAAAAAAVAGIVGTSTRSLVVVAAAAALRSIPGGGRGAAVLPPPLPRHIAGFFARRTLTKRCPVTAGFGAQQHQQQRKTGSGSNLNDGTSLPDAGGSRSTFIREGDSGRAAAAAASLSVASPSTAQAITLDQGLKSIEELDGPPGWPIVGNFLTYLKKENRGKMHEVQARLHKVYGSMFREKWGPSWQVHVSDPATIEVVYRHEGRYPHRPPLESWILYRQLVNKPCGLFTAQGREWHLYRTELSKRILCPQTTKGLIAPISAVADDLVLRLRHVRDSDGEHQLTRSLPNEMYKWSLEAAATFLFETRLGCLQNEIPARTQQFIDVTQEMLTSSLYLIVGEKLHQRFNTRYWQRHKAAWDTMFQIGKELIDKRIKELLEERSDGRGTNGVFLTYLLANNKISMDQVHSNITELLVAGTDTMANSFCFIVQLLATNKAVQEKLYDEIVSVVGHQQPNSDDQIAFNALEELKYLKCVIKESMRLYPVITMNCRILDEDIVLNGHLVPKKTLIVVNHYASGHDDEVFPNASQFLPERWMREETVGPLPSSLDPATKHHPFACLPFGVGKRNCVGQRVAKMELMITLIKMMQQFRLEPYPGVEFNPVLRTLLTPGEHVPVRFVDRAATP